MTARNRFVAIAPLRKCFGLVAGNDGGGRHPKNQKAGPGPAALQRCLRPHWVPGRSEAPPGLEGYFFFDFLAFFAFFAFFAFLAIASSFGFNGWKRDTRHARRRASLATSSTPIPTDSQAAAPCCHAGVITLSTVVMGFEVVLAVRSARSGDFLRTQTEPSHSHGLVQG
jgi:hypothetical protein